MVSSHLDDLGSPAQGPLSRVTGSLFSVAISIGLIAALFALPSLQSLYAQYGQELPAISTWTMEHPKLIRGAVCILVMAQNALMIFYWKRASWHAMTAFWIGCLLCGAMACFVLAAMYLPVIRMGTLV